MLVSEKIQFAFEMYLHFSMSCLNSLFIPPSSFILFQPHTRKNVYRNFLKAMNFRKHNNFNNLTFSDSSKALICFIYKPIHTKYYDCIHIYCITYLCHQIKDISPDLQRMVRNTTKINTFCRNCIIYVLCLLS